MALAFYVNALLCMLSDVFAESWLRHRQRDQRVKIMLVHRIHQLACARFIMPTLRPARNKSCTAAALLAIRNGRPCITVLRAMMAAGLRLVWVNSMLPYGVSITPLGPVVMMVMRRSALAQHVHAVPVQCL
jgi:hypothetical protein